ncbi:MAG: hypothetical protein ABGX43_00050 [Nitrospinaceae bacterium]
MRLLNFLLITPFILFSPLLLDSAKADIIEDCHFLFRPFENMAHGIKARGGTWALFEKREIYRNHAIIGLHVDSKITSLIYTINYVCESQKQMPINPVSNQVVPMMKEKGREGFIKYYMNLSHPLEEVKIWAEYANYFEAHKNRKLDFNLTKKTIETAGTFFERYIDIDKRIKSTNDVEEVVKEGKAIIDDIKQFHITDPILVQVNAENLRIPHASTLTQIADEM